MTTNTTTTTMPACPAWCSGDHDQVSLRGRVDVGRQHVTRTQEPGWIERMDVLRADGTWEAGPVLIGMSEDFCRDLDTAAARALGAELIRLADWADRVAVLATQEGRDALAAELSEATGRPVTVRPI
ncbi:MAG: hypothetical protein U0R76_07425 [Candidatus Nanopelagicales bacterium]